MVSSCIQKAVGEPAAFLLQMQCYPITQVVMTGCSCYNRSMWNKVYFALLLIGFLATGFFAWYAWSWLGSIGDPRTAWDGYLYHRSLAISTIVGWTILLLAAGTVVLWSSRSSIALWSSAVFFLVSALMVLVILNAAANTFCIENGLCEFPTRAAGVLITVFVTLGLVGLIVFDQYVLLRLQEKMYGGDEAETENSRSDETES